MKGYITMNFHSKTMKIHIVMSSHSTSYGRMSDEETVTVHAFMTNLDVQRSTGCTSQVYIQEYIKYLKQS